MEKTYWPDWAFASMILFNEVCVTRHVVHGGNEFTLEVDLRDQAYGIYNNAGKNFLANEWGGAEAFTRTALERSQKVLDFLENPRKDVLRLDCAGLPLRWASGGFVPVVDWRGEKWFALFFRDINPVGWNVPNGASESKEEYKNVKRLILREFGEELLVLGTEPEADCHYFPYDLAEGEHNDLVESFAARHLQLRRDHDRVNIMRESAQKIGIRVCNTPFDLRVAFHDRNFETRHSDEDRVLFQINPCEFGIEILQVCEMRLPDESYLLDGEIGIQKAKEFLVRRPVMLLRLEKLREIYTSGAKSLGSVVQDPAHLECKQLGCQLTKQDFHIFGAELVLRARRIDTLIAREKKGDESRKFERELLQEWQKDYAPQFRAAVSAGNITVAAQPDLLCFCPAAWKAIEQIFQYGIL